MAARQNIIDNNGGLFLNRSQTAITSSLQKLNPNVRPFLRHSSSSFQTSENKRYFPKRMLVTLLTYHKRVVPFIPNIAPPTSLPMTVAGGRLGCSVEWKGLDWFEW